MTEKINLKEDVPYQVMDLKGNIYVGFAYVPSFLCKFLNMFRNRKIFMVLKVSNKKFGGKSFTIKNIYRLEELE